MKTMTVEQTKKIQQFEAQGDEFIEKESFYACLSAIDCYMNAQDMLYNYANNDNIKNAKPQPAFNSDNVSYNAWYVLLGNKISKTQQMLTDPKIAKK